MGGRVWICDVCWWDGRVTFGVVVGGGGGGGCGSVVFSGGRGHTRGGGGRGVGVGGGGGGERERGVEREGGWRERGVERMEERCAHIYITIVFIYDTVFYSNTSHTNGEVLTGVSVATPGDWSSIRGNADSLLSRFI